MARFVQSPEGLRFRDVHGDETVFGDGDWKERLEAVFRKYGGRDASNEAAHAELHVHLHIHEQRQPQRPVAPVIRPLARRAMAREAATT